jgi:hypothetical protein
MSGAMLNCFGCQGNKNKKLNGIEMSSKTALGYVLDDDGTLIDVFIQAPTELIDIAPEPAIYKPLRRKGNKS